LNEGERLQSKGYHGMGLLSYIGIGAFPRLKRTVPLRAALNHKPVPQRTPGDLPRRIYMFWDSGEESAPEIVKLCIQSWRDKNPRWVVEVLDQKSANQILPRAMFPDSLNTAHYSDLLRITLLRERGGVWADATCLCMRPLDEWIINAFNQSSFFAFSLPGRTTLISNWFLAGAKDSIVVRKQHDASMRYWTGKALRWRDPPYFWFHYLFEYLVRTDREFRHEWTNRVNFSAEPPHLLQRFLQKKKEPLSSKGLDRIAATPVQKLSHKLPIDLSELSSVLDDVEKRQ